MRSSNEAALIWAQLWPEIRTNYDYGCTVKFYLCIADVKVQLGTILVKAISSECLSDTTREFYWCSD